jgi:hypothetical protein
MAASRPGWRSRAVTLTGFRVPGVYGASSLDLWLGV